MTRRVSALTLAALAVAGCGGGGGKPVAVDKPSTIELTSPRLRDAPTLPVELSCDGSGEPPPFRWSHVPEGTREIAFTVDDPDAPGGDFMHWTLWHIDPRARGLTGPPSGSRTAKNSAGKLGYTPPCPPKGDSPHRYVFTVFALRRPLAAPNGADAGAVRDEIAAATLAKGQLTARFGR